MMGRSVWRHYMLQDAYAEWANKSNRRVEHSSSLGKKLKELAQIKTARPSATDGSSRQRVYVLPSLGECRRRWDTKTRQAWDWGDDDEEFAEEPKPATGRAPRERPMELTHGGDDAPGVDDSDIRSKVGPGCFPPAGAGDQLGVEIESLQP